MVNYGIEWLQRAIQRLEMELQDADSPGEATRIQLQIERLKHRLQNKMSRMSTRGF